MKLLGTASGGGNSVAAILCGDAAELCVGRHRECHAYALANKEPFGEGQRGGCRQVRALTGWNLSARTINAAKKYVVSTTLDRVDWNAELVRGDLGKAVQQLKQESGKGLFVGGVKLPLALAELGLNQGGSEQSRRHSATSPTPRAASWSRTGRTSKPATDIE